MVKLSELKTHTLLKALVYGEPGAGKTCTAAGLPAPILYLDFDNKISSAARFYKNDPVRLEQIHVENLSSQLATDPIVRMNEIVLQLRTMQSKGEYIYKSLVLDSLTTFSTAALNHIIRTNPGMNRVKNTQGAQPSQGDYGILKREFERLIPGILTLDMNIMMLGHITVDKDETTGEIIRGVLLDGSFAQKLPIYFDEAWRSYVDDKGRFMLQTKPDARFTKLRSQIQGLPNPCEAKYSEIAKFLV